MEYQSKYLEFKQVPYEGKTKRFEVMSVKHGYSLGRLSWHGAWRCYVFSPAFETMWNKDCLKDIQDFLQQLMDERTKCQVLTQACTNNHPKQKCGAPTPCSTHGEQ